MTAPDFLGLCLGLLSTAKMHIVATTIWLPRFLDSYLDNLRRYGHIDDVKIWVVGDHKTPRESADYAARMRGEGLAVEYLDPESQKSWLSGYPDLAAIVPWNSDNRRNVGFLRALEEGCEVLVSIDDDNFAIERSDFYSGHLHTGKTIDVEVIGSEAGWYNICEELHLNPPIDAIPRGYPYQKKGSPHQSAGTRRRAVVANAGLWLGDPDVDAATRLTCRLEATGARERQIALHPGTWSPINTQNTSVARRAIPAYYYVRMLEDLPGAKLDRYGDIWSGYFLTRCAEHLGECIAVGLPLVQHNRNQHDLMSDLRAEIWGMVVTPHIIDALRDSTLTGSNYSEATRSLAACLAKRAKEIEERVRLTGIADYIARIGQYLNVWVDVCGEFF